MAEEKIVGVVIKILDFEDTAQIVTILTGEEIITVMALGVRKLTSKNRVALQLGNIVEAIIFRARLNNKISKLKKAVLLTQAPIQKKDTAKQLMIILQHLNLVKFPHPTLFQKIINAFQHLGTENNQYVKTFVIYNILESIGYKQNINSCIECGDNQRIQGFEFYEGGFTCIEHTVKKRSLDVLKAINALNNMDEYIKTPSNIDTDICTELISYIKENTFV